MHSLPPTLAKDVDLGRKRNQSHSQDGAGKYDNKLDLTTNPATANPLCIVDGTPHGSSLDIPVLRVCTFSLSKFRIPAK
jgi:hypothetical protein